MQYLLTLWPHANVRYRAVTQKLAAAELELILGRVAPEAGIAQTDHLGLPALRIDTADPLPGHALEALRTHSLLFGLYAVLGDGALSPLAGRETPALGEDLPGVLKYKGKTNEMFTQLLINAALLSADTTGGTVRLLDPMCGRGTTLFIGANRGWNCTGSDVDRRAVKEADDYFKRYLEYHRLKHSRSRGSLTVRGRAVPCVDYGLPDGRTLRLAETDAADVRAAFGAGAFDLIVCDLPYGVQHASKGGTPEALLARALPSWREALAPGGAIAVSFNAQTLKAETVRGCMEAADLAPLRGGPYDRFAHWVEQAVTRDLAVCRKGTAQRR